MFVHLQSLLQHKTGSSLEGCIQCCFLKKEILLLKDPNKLGWATTNMTEMDGENFSVINVSIESFLQYPNEPYEKNYQADTDALNKNLVQYRGKTGLSKHPL